MFSGISCLEIRRGSGWRDGDDDDDLQEPDDKCIIYLSSIVLSNFKYTKITCLKKSDHKIFYKAE